MSRTRVLTAYSIYEIEPLNKRVRRLAGINSPTPRQGNDGEWQPYQALHYTLENTLLFVWGDNPDGTQKCTETSHIVSIESVELAETAKENSDAGN